MNNKSLYFSGIFLSFWGSSLFLVAMVIWLKETHQMASHIGVFLFLNAIASILVTPFAGVMVDRTNPKKILIYSDVINGVLMLLLSGLIFFRPFLEVELPLVMLLTLLSALSSALFLPASLSLIGQIVKKEEVMSLVSTRSNLVESSKLIGRATSGVLVALVGAPIIIFINGLSFLGSALLEGRIQSEEKPKSPNEKSYFKDIQVAFNYVKENYLLKRFFIGAAITNFCMSAGTTVFPNLIKDVMGYELWWYGVVMSAFGFGALIGGYVAGRVKQTRSSRVFTLALVLQGLPYLFFNFASHPLHIIFIMSTVGFVFVFVQVQMITLVNHSTPEKLRGRVFALMSAIVGSLMPISYLLTGFVADRLGANIIHIYTASGVIIPSVWLVITSHFMFDKAMLSSSFADQ